MVIKLSKKLNKLSKFNSYRKNIKFRNPNGVSMKLFNFLRFAPNYEGKRLSRGGKLEEVVWNGFFQKRELLKKSADIILGIINLEEEEKGKLKAIEFNDIYSVSEGSVILKWHKVHERNSTIIKNKKKTLEKHGVLKCEVCDFDFKNFYGEIGEIFIECHHKTPVVNLQHSKKTTLKDLALVCSNCHRILHRGNEVISIEELKEEIIFSRK